MPFFAYRVSSLNSGDTRATDPVGVELAGNSGPLRLHAVSQFHGSVPECWQANETDLLNLLGFAPSEHALIVDLKPSVAKEVSLYRILRVWGRSEADWTPLALQLQALYVDHPVTNVFTFKANFQLPSTTALLIHEFLYLRGGTETGDWVWGRNGSVNATLLWPEAFAWFADQIRPYV